MKFIFLLLIIPLLHVSASTNAQNITINKQNVSLAEVFREVRRQTDYDFVYSAKQLADAKKVSLNVTNSSLIDVLEKCFINQPLTYQINQKTITIKEKSPDFLDRIMDRLTDIDVHGVVHDDQGLPLAGATVIIKGTTRSTKTNDKGEFYFENVDKNASLVISYLGYEIQEIKVLENLGTIKLVLNIDKLQEINIVSTGYQNIPKERATGSFTQIDNKNLNRNVGVNILDRLEGIASGLLLNKGLPTQGGANNAKIAVRGRSTIFASAEPTIVLDGFPYNGTIEQINPADVSTITILKDAAAASIWGAKASNGVIVITTKKGKRNQKLAIEVSSALSVTDKPDLYYSPQIASQDMIDLQQYLFSRGFYTNILNVGYSPVPPAIEVSMTVKPIKYQLPILHLKLMP